MTHTISFTVPDDVRPAVFEEASRLSVAALADIRVYSDAIQAPTSLIADGGFDPITWSVSALSVLKPTYTVTFDTAEEANEFRSVTAGVIHEVWVAA